MGYWVPTEFSLDYKHSQVSEIFLVSESCWYPYMYGCNQKPLDSDILSTVIWSHIQCVRLCNQHRNQEKLLSREWEADNYHDSYFKCFPQPSWPRLLEKEIKLKMMSKVGWISDFQCLDLFYIPHLPVWGVLEYEDALPFSLKHLEIFLCVLHFLVYIIYLSHRNI